MKKNFFIALVAMAVISCSKDDSTSGTVALKASAVSSTGTTSKTAKSATSNVVVTDFKINVGHLRFERKKDDKLKEADSVFKTEKLNGPFLLDLINGSTLSGQAITTVTTPNGKYTDVKLKFLRSAEAGEMLDKTYLIKGTVNGQAFAIWSGKESDVKMTFEDPAKEFDINGNNVSLNLKVKLDALLEKLTDLSNKGLLNDTDGDGIIEISTDSDDDNGTIGIGLKTMLEGESKLDDKN